MADFYINPTCLSLTAYPDALFSNPASSSFISYYLCMSFSCDFSIPVPVARALPPSPPEKLQSSLLTISGGNWYVLGIGSIVGVYVSLWSYVTSRQLRNYLLSCLKPGAWNLPVVREAKSAAIWFSLAKIETWGKQKKCASQNPCLEWTCLNVQHNFNECTSWIVKVLYFKWFAFLKAVIPP